MTRPAVSPLGGPSPVAMAAELLADATRYRDQAEQLGKDLAAAERRAERAEGLARERDTVLAAERRKVRAAEERAAAAEAELAEVQRQAVADVEAALAEFAESLDQAAREAADELLVAVEQARADERRRMIRQGQAGRARREQAEAERERRTAAAEDRAAAAEVEGRRLVDELDQVRAELTAMTRRAESAERAEAALVRRGRAYPV